ncbi:hypothetical protein [Nakamurella lactea]|jgi:hypothetical protein|uniref:hypothetical protein n=1 Tax=Nakamurella lactea TaxID=459515 RepID=UPI0004264BFE|nr:hypothetical protein [Nakamurella lactea]
MSYRFVYWYQSQWSAAAAVDLVEALEAAGWTLVSPSTGVISKLTLSGQVRMDRSGLLAAMALEGEIDDLHTDWWLDGGSGNVHYGIRRRSAGGVLHEFLLDGVRDLDRVVHDLLDRIHDHAAETIGFVVDRDGASQDLDWDAVMAGADVPIDDVPDILGLTVELAELHPDLPYRHRTFAFQNLVIADWVDLYRQPPPAGTLWN